VKRTVLRVSTDPVVYCQESPGQMDVGPFFFTQHNPTQPTMLTQGPNPTHPSHIYVKCIRHQYCIEPIFLHVRWRNKHPVSGCDWWLSSCTENSHPLYTTFEPNTSPAFFFKTTIACTLSVHCVCITRVICKFSWHIILRQTQNAVKKITVLLIQPNPTQPMDGPNPCALLY